MRAELVFVVAIIGFLIGLVPSLLDLPTEVAWLLAAAGLVLATVFLVRDVLGLLGRWSSWSMRRLQPVRFPESLTVPFLPVIIETPTGRVAIDPNLDAALATAQNRIQWSVKPYRLPDELARLAPYILRTSASGRWPFNGPDVALETDLSLAAIESGEEIKARPGNFFSELCSNELTGWAISSSGNSIDFKERYLFDSRNQLLSLGQSQLANGIGVSTLAITSDSKLVLTLQSVSSQTSGGMWAPSGSGALEPRDGLDGHDSLLIDVVIRGAERELCEEGRIKPAWIRQSRVIGYSRWLDRGGKPEFYCVTSLSVHSSELRTGSGTHSMLSEERTWTSDVQVLDVNLTTIKGFDPGDPASHTLPLWARAGLIPNVDILTGSTSVPLHASLDALARTVHRSPHLLADLELKQSR